MHDLPLITTIAAAFTAAWLLGLLTQRLGLSPIVGYLLAGVLIGPHTPGFAGDVHLAQQLAEIGVILLMFGVGLHFHLDDLLAVKSIAIPGAIGQSLVATLLGLAVFSAFGLPLSSATVIGAAMAVASTVVLMRVLMDAGALESADGHAAVGWLLVEDIFTVVVLVLIPALAGDGAEPAAGPFSLSLVTALGWAILKLVALAALLMVAGRRAIPWVLVQVARLRSRELFTLTVLVFSIAIAAGSYALFGASMALGAFLAGMVVAQSPVSHQAAADALPLRDAFAVLFFVSVGMLFDPAFLVQKPLMIVAALSVILIAKPLAALAIVALLGHSARTALTVAVGLAQIGEFSFILSDLARKHELMPEVGQNALVAAAIISITLNPLLFRGVGPLETWLRRRPKLWAALNGRAERRMQSANLIAQEQIARHLDSAPRLALVVGFGPVGRSVHRLLADAGLATVVIDMNLDTVSELNAQGITSVFGDASHESILAQAGMRRASHLIVTLPRSSDQVAVAAAGRSLNAGAKILVRARYLRERESLEQAGATAAVFEEAEAAIALARLVLADTGARGEAAEQKIRDLRLQLLEENLSDLRLHPDRIDGDFPDKFAASLYNAIEAGGFVIEMTSRTRNEAIAELAAAIPPARLPSSARIAELALARENAVSTDLGVGMAIPHARCANLSRPLAVFGRSSAGIAFSAQADSPVRLVFLLVIPADRPETHLSLLAQLARIAADASLRERLLNADSPGQIIEILSE
jgi:CPA2 family monovalent cation:H+ antiporter-2